MIRTSVRRAIALGVLSLTLLGLGPVAASAVAVEPMAASVTSSAPASPSQTATASVFDVAPTVWTKVDDDGTGYTDDSSRFLTTNRWQVGSSSFHGRFDQFLQTDVITYTQRTITQSQVMMGGNGLYAVTQGILDFSLTLEPLNLLGGQADAVAATIGEALLKNSPVVVGLVVLIVAGVIFSMARNPNRPWKRLVSIVGVVALFAVMIAGASASTGGTGAADGEEFRPGLMSPGWFATKINDSITTIATVPAQALVLANPIEGSASPEGTGCYAYLGNLSDRYEASASSGASIPLIISSLWDASGLSVWKQTQYGSKAYDEATGATYGDEVFCHQLDWQSDVSSVEQAYVTFGTLSAAKTAGYKSKSAAWGAEDNDQRDRSLIAWAACENDGRGNFTVRTGFAKGGDWIKSSDCVNWWTEDSADTGLGAFNVGGKSSDVTDKTDDAAVINFIQTLHGNDTNAGLLLIWTYVISAFLIMLIFGGLGIAIVIAKFAGVVMIVSVFFVLMMSLLAKQDMGSKLMQYLKTYLGFSVFAFGATLILAMITILSKMISGTGNTVFGQGSIMALIWIGLSPVIATWMLHLIFTKLLKMPSVFKPSSAMAWGAAGGAVGGALGQSLARREGRAGSIARNMAGRAGRRAGEYAKGGVRAAGARARGGRNGMMAPGNVGGGSLGGSALSGAAFAVGASAIGKRNKSNEEEASDEKTLTDARAYAESKRPKVEPATGSRLDRTAAASGRLTRATLDKVKAGRSQAKTMATPAYRAELKARGGKAIGAARERLSTASEKTKTVGNWLHDDPIGAAGYMAENAGHSMRKAARAGGAVAARGAQAGHRAVTNPNTQAAVRAVSKVGLGAAIGTVIAGPVGGIAGAAIGGGRARATIAGAHRGRDAKLVSDYLEHKQNTQPEKSTPADAAPARSAEVPDRPAVG